MMENHVKDIECASPKISLLEKRLKVMVPHPTLFGRQRGYSVRVQAILCTNDDGTPQLSFPPIDANYLVQVIAATNIVYKNTGIQFVYNPATDFEHINNSFLNLDFDLPPQFDPSSDTDPDVLPFIDDAIYIKAHRDALNNEGKRHRHKMVLFFRDGCDFGYDKNLGHWIYRMPRGSAYSGFDSEFVSLPAYKWGNNIDDLAHLIAHETGHYFHLGHTHGPGPENIADAAEIIRNGVEKEDIPEDDGLNVFDGDILQDTPPDAGNGIFHGVYGFDGCGMEDSLIIPVTFSDNHIKEYILKPDRRNVMSYFKHCKGFFPMHFSPLQIAIMQDSFDGNRLHLIYNQGKISDLVQWILDHLLWKIIIPAWQKITQPFRWVFTKLFK